MQRVNSLVKMNLTQQWATLQRKCDIMWPSVLETFTQKDNQGLLMESDKHFCRAVEHYKNIGWVISLQFGRGRWEEIAQLLPASLSAPQSGQSAVFDPGFLFHYLFSAFACITQSGCAEKISSFHVTFLAVSKCLHVFRGSLTQPWSSEAWHLTYTIQLRLNLLWQKRWNYRK